MSFHSLPQRASMDLLCPMHVSISTTGHITHVGPTLRKLRPGKPWVGQRFLETFRLSRPREVQSMRELGGLAGRKLHFELREAPRTSLKGVVAPLESGDGFVINMSFGISIIEAVRDFDLNSADFAPTDLTIEMLYLMEAKSVAMRASQKLNERLEKAKAEAERQASTDALTGLNNRRAMDMRLQQLLASKTPFAMMHVDLDYFKAVNDTLGHAAGDFVLHNVAATFESVLREEDHIARVGGDEFVILMPELLNRNHIETIGARLIEGLERPLDFNGNICKISGSIGTLVWDATTSATPDTLLDDADIALYASKNAGRGRQTFYAPHLREEAQTMQDAPAKSVELWD